MNKPTIAAKTWQQGLRLYLQGSQWNVWAGAGVYELCRKQLFQYLSLYVIFFLLHRGKQVWLHVIYLDFATTGSWSCKDSSDQKKKSVQLSDFSRSLAVISLQPCSHLKWMLRIQLREWEWMDLMLSLPCSTKLCTGALFIHQTRPCSSNPLTKKFRINWQHQSGDTANRQLSSSVHDANNIQYGEKEELAVFYVSSPRFLCQNSVSLWSL